MIIKLSRLLLAATIIHCSSSAITHDSAVEDVQEQDRPSLRGRRHLMKEYTCTLFQKCVSYEASEDHPNGHHQDSWVCKLSKADSANLNTQFVDVVGATIANATSGKSVLTISKGSIDAEKSILYVAQGANVVLSNSRTQHRHIDIVANQGKDKEKVPKTGTLRTLVIRIIDRNNNAPRISAEKLKDDVFDDGVSLKTQPVSCFYLCLITVYCLRSFF